MSNRRQFLKSTGAAAVASLVAKAALYISIAALVAGVVQALAALNIIEPFKPTSNAPIASTPK